MVCLRDDAAVFHAVSVVILTAAQLCCLEAETKFNALDGGDGKDELADPVFQTAEHRRSQPSRNAEHAALNDPADGVFLRARLRNGCLHFPGSFVARHGEILLRDRRVKFGRIPDSGNGVNARHDLDALFMQQLLADAARNAKRRRQPAGKMPAARDVLKAAEFDLRGIIGMSGARNIHEIAVIL